MAGPYKGEGGGRQSMQFLKDKFRPSSLSFFSSKLSQSRLSEELGHMLL